MKTLYIIVVLTALSAVQASHAQLVPPSITVVNFPNPPPTPPANYPPAGVIYRIAIIPGDETITSIHLVPRKATIKLPGALVVDFPEDWIAHFDNRGLEIAGPAVPVAGNKIDLLFIGNTPNVTDDYDLYYDTPGTNGPPVLHLYGQVVMPAVAVPEPGAFAWFGGLVLLAGILLRGVGRRSPRAVCESAS
jgi:hypothetical protein